MNDGLFYLEPVIGHLSGIAWLPTQHLDVANRIRRVARQHRHQPRQRRRLRAIERDLMRSWYPELP